MNSTLANTDHNIGFSRAASAIRALAMDAVQRAGSGHPGMPMGMADIAEVLWTRHLKHNPRNPHWQNRDRFVLSNGHGSMLLYALLHLSGYDVSIDDLKAFRELHSKTPGHPEYGITPGVETTTGPLGQGVANGVGMALAEKLLAQEFNRPGLDIVDHHTYVFLGDGCLMEGISHEACAVAGTLGLGKLICLYDQNNISIDGDVSGWFTDNTPQRFASYGWHVVADVDGHDADAVDDAIREAKAAVDRPSLICCRRVIGRGAPRKAGTAKVHGEALGLDEVAATRRAMGWEYPPFDIPEDVYAVWDARERGVRLEKEWQEVFTRYQERYPSEAAEFLRRTKGSLPAQWQQEVASFIAITRAKAETIATRKASQNAIEYFAAALPEVFGGSADLTGSNLTNWSTCKTVSHDKPGNYLSYGVREFGMAAIMSGIALHGGYIPFGGTFLVFSDYARNALRVAALMKLRAIYVFTHDSIGLGSDGPTHQPVEHLASLRLIPGLDVWRPCDTVETAVAWACSLGRQDGPSALVLSRQTLPFQNRSDVVCALIDRGAYVLEDAPGRAPQAVIIATGSEVQIAMHAHSKLSAQGVAVRVVSAPSMDVFDRQDGAYRSEVLPDQIPRVAIEAGSSAAWFKYVHDGEVLGIDRFGESASGEVLFEHFGLTVEKLVDAVLRVISHYAMRPHINTSGPSDLI